MTSGKRTRPISSARLFRAPEGSRSDERQTATCIPEGLLAKAGSGVALADASRLLLQIIPLPATISIAHVKPRPLYVVGLP